MTWPPSGAAVVRARNGRAAKAKVHRHLFASFVAPDMKAIPYRPPKPDEHEQLALAF